ncbi:MAG TPA: tRNA epoxyqueuosine(34) reductase QueG [Anaerolineae bacterium]|nr:tRNA epoxyqueuosine(34) reductase QueG [Anaerolineae bacterium]
MNLTERIKLRAIELGFDLVGIAPAGVAPHAKEYADWVAAGMLGEMAYMSRDPDRRSDLRRLLPGAQSVIVVGLSHYTLQLSEDVKNDPSRGLIARYAWGVDYHAVMTPRLNDLAKFVRVESSRDVESKVYVDTGAVLERDWAQMAGLGFIGKNTCLINPHMGSWLFLGVLITDLDLEIDQPQKHVSCGNCSRCLVACPTDAFTSPYILDARKCISYLTIELRGSIPIELRSLMSNRIFGCDICQDVCPWPTRFAQPTHERSFFPVDLDRAGPRLIDLARLSEDQFKVRFAGTPILRSKRRGLLRNVAVALGNWGSIEAREALQMLSIDPDPIVAEHAEWGLFATGG